MKCLKLTDNQLAILFINLQSLSDILLNISVKEVTVIVPNKFQPIDVCFVRTFFLFLNSIAMLKYFNINPLDELLSKSTNQKKIFSVRIIGGVLAQTGFIFAIKLLPISFAQIIINLNPFFVAILACIFTNNKLTLLDIIGVLGSFSGVVLLIYDENSEGVSKVNYGMILGVFSAFCVAIGAAMNAITTRSLKNFNWALIVFWFSGFMTSVYFTWLLIDYRVGGDARIFKQPFLPNWPWMLSIALTNMASLILRIRAFQLGKSLLISNLKYMGIVYSFLTDIFFFDVKFTKMQIIGAAIVIVFNIQSMVVSIYNETKAEKKNEENKEVDMKEIKHVEIPEISVTTQSIDATQSQESTQR